MLKGSQQHVIHESENRTVDEHARTMKQKHSLLTEHLCQY